jgi:hypothetical protein
MMKQYGHRVASLILAVTAGILGILSRTYPEMLPVFIARFAGDTLWAFALYFLLRIFFPLKPIILITSVCFVISVFIEFSQLYQADWINHLRASRIGALILGYTFVWTDLLCYLSGCILAASFDFLIIRKGKRII